MDVNSNYSIDTQVISDMMNGIKTSLETYIDNAFPILAGIGCAALVFYLGRFIFRLVKNWLAGGK